MRASGLPLLPLLLLIIALLPRGLYLREDFHTWWDKNDPPAYNDPVFIDRMLNEHNRLRAMVEPPASDMLYLTWDVKLSEIAKTYIEKCIFTHNPDLDNPHVLHPVFRVVGENLWLGNPGATIVATESWYNETKFYTYSTQACTNECGHYKQVVWGNTYKLGCAAHVCDSVKGFDGEYYMIVLCNYGPAGNYPHQPYTSGASCTACPAGDKCENKLCRNPTRDTMDRLPFTPTDKKAKGGTGSASGSASGGHAGTETGGHAAERADVSKASLPLDHLVLHVLLFNCCYTLFYLVYQ
ncbi:glioma pathogenesis-related protein 1-like isoform X4 [Ambystoma mexicanum]|uniref:glioma pathogenesis-related protein 1-like isoform X4 n=1 Tax=Ambystoma mexicanum TaxID=8296 RepID=UPI0037E7F693